MEKLFLNDCKHLYLCRQIIAAMWIQDLTPEKRQKLFIWAIWGIIVGPVVLIGFLLFLVNLELFGPIPTFSELENPKSNIASEIYSSNGTLLGTYHIENRSFIDYEDLSPYIVKSLIATEDARFIQHSGIDVIGLGRVVFKTILLGDRNSGGGSTITQQLAKNLFPRDTALYDNAFSRMGLLVTSKLKEWVTAVKLERNYTKNEILAMYLNVVPFGSNAFGVRAASMTFFKKEPAELSMEEAALMVGVINAPTRYSPVRNPERSLRRRNFVLKQTYKADFISEAEYNTAISKPLSIDYQMFDQNAGLAPYFREMVKRMMNAKRPDPSAYKNREYYVADSLQWANNPLYGWCHKNKKKDGTSYDLSRDGLRLYSTIDARLQRYAEQSLTQHLAELQPQFNAEIKRKEGRIFAYDVSRGAAQQIMDRAVRGSERYRNMRNRGVAVEEILATFNKRVPMTIFTWRGEKDTMMTPMDSIRYYKSIIRGSLLAVDPITGQTKAYVGGPNFKYFKYDHISQGRRQVGSTIKPFLYTLAMQEGFTPCTMAPNVPQTFIVNDTTWTPRNASKSALDGKMVSLKWGLTTSNNNISAWLIKQFNPESMAAMCHTMGITAYIPPYPSICLGISEISMMEMVAAYAVYANRGEHIQPTFITRIEDRHGNVLARFKQGQRKEVISEETTYLMTNMMENVVRQGTGRRLQYRYQLNGTIAGKTGTTQNQSDGWFMGLTPYLSSGVWVGWEDMGVHFESMALGQGANTALPIYGLFMQKVLADGSIGYNAFQPFYVPEAYAGTGFSCEDQSEDDQVGTTDKDKKDEATKKEGTTEAKPEVKKKTKSENFF